MSDEKEDHDVVIEGPGRLGVGDDVKSKLTAFSIVDCVLVDFGLGVESHDQLSAGSGYVAEKLRRRGPRPPPDSAAIPGKPPLPLHAQVKEGLRLRQVRARSLAQRVSGWGPH